MPNASYDSPHLTTFCRLQELGLEVIGQRLERTGRWWSAGCCSPTGGAAGAAAPAPCGTP